MTKTRDFSTCPRLGKRGYRSRRVAAKVRRGHPDRRHLGVYRCQHCTYWHLGHRPPDLIAGRISRHDLP